MSIAFGIWKVIYFPLLRSNHADEMAKIIGLQSVHIWAATLMTEGWGCLRDMIRRVEKYFQSEREEQSSWAECNRDIQPVALESYRQPEDCDSEAKDTESVPTELHHAL